MAKNRPNVIPIIEDARHPQKYRMLVPMVDAVFADVAQPDQVSDITAHKLLTALSISHHQAYAVKKGSCKIALMSWHTSCCGLLRPQIGQQVAALIIKIKTTCCERGFEFA